LRGSRQIVLEGVSHFTGFGGPWYGDAEVIPQWWSSHIGSVESKDEFATSDHI